MKGMKDKYFMFTIDTIKHPYWMDRFVIEDEFHTVLFDSSDYCHKSEAGKYTQPSPSQDSHLLQAILAQLEYISEQLDRSYRS